MEKMRLTAPCIFGLEKTLSFEIKKAGGENIEITDGHLFFDGDYSVIARCNISCSAAERIGIVLTQCTVYDFDDVFNCVLNVPIENFAAKNDILHVLSGHSLKSKLSAIPALQRTIKKALVKRMSEKYNTAILPESGAELRIDFNVLKDNFTLILDTTGEGLHKRGYRAHSNAAPLRETLAAGICDIARVRKSDNIFDPFCGSGTILIEAVYKALRIPPGSNRNFSAMNWSSFPAAEWENARNAAMSEILNEPDFVVTGYDVDPLAVRLTKENAAKAGVAAHIRVTQAPVSSFSPPDNAKIICNPPYAERMLDKTEAAAVYSDMAATFLPKGSKQIYILCANDDFESCFGKAPKNRKLYNGMLKSRLLMY